MVCISLFLHFLDTFSLSLSLSLSPPPSSSNNQHSHHSIEDDDDDDDDKLDFNVNTHSNSSSNSNHSNESQLIIKKAIAALQKSKQVQFLPDIPYNSISDKNTLDLILPIDEKTDEVRAHAPLLIFLHGGLWGMGDKSEGLVLAHYYAIKRKMAVALINYRLAEQHHQNSLKHPVQALDVSDAFAWLKHKAPHYKYDINRVYLIGHSVGAHMIGLFSLSQSKYSMRGLIVRGAIGIDGIYDTRRFYHDESEWRQYIEYAMPDDKKTWDSPQDFSNSDCESEEVLSWPWLLIHSLEDRWVNVNQAENFAKHLHQLGIPVELKKLKNGRSHDEVLRNIGTPSLANPSKGSDDPTPMIDKFIDSVEAEANWQPVPSK